MEWLSKKDAAKYAGISIPTLDKWIRSGLVIGRVGGRVLINRVELDKFIASCGKCSSQEEGV